MTITYEDKVENANLLSIQAMRAASDALGMQPEDVSTMEAAASITIALRGLTFAVLAVADRVDAVVDQLQGRL